MPASRLKALLEEADQLLATGGERFIPMWVQLVRCERMPTPDGSDTDVYPVERLPKLYGGLWDSVLQMYVPGAEPGPGQVKDVLVHRKQLEVLLYKSPPGKAEWVKRLMVLGAPGAGKTILLAIEALLDGLENPHYVIGMVGATADRVEVLWNDMEKVAGTAGMIAFRSKHAKGGPVMTLWNGARYEFVAAKEPSKATGSPIQGRSWHRCKVDEAQNVTEKAQKDIGERGRVNGKLYRVTESATNIMDGREGAKFMMRRETYKSNPQRDIVRITAYDNIFVHPNHWETERLGSNEREWRQRMMAEDLPPEWLVYHQFAYQENVKPAPLDRRLDITRQVLEDRFQHERRFTWVAGTDFGILWNVTIWLKAFEVPGIGRCWWAMSETSSDHRKTTRDHARSLLNYHNAADFILIGDPHDNKSADKSDYEVVRSEGIVARKAGEPPIRVKARIAMLNDLFGPDGRGHRRLFINLNDKGQPTCPRLVASLMQMTIDEWGNPEGGRKDYSDPTHWPAALAYGLYPFERLRALPKPDTEEEEDPIIAKAMAKAAARR